MEEVPEEVLLYIFGFVKMGGTKNLLACRQVSRKWLEIASDKSLGIDRFLSDHREIKSLEARQFAIKTLEKGWFGREYTGLSCNNSWSSCWYQDYLFYIEHSKLEARLLVYPFPFPSSSTKNSSKEKEVQPIGQFVLAGVKAEISIRNIRIWPGEGMLVLESHPRGILFGDLRELRLERTDSSEGPPPEIQCHSVTSGVCMGFVDWLKTPMMFFGDDGSQLKVLQRDSAKEEGGWKVVPFFDWPEDTELFSFYTGVKVCKEGNCVLVVVTDKKTREKTRLAVFDLSTGKMDQSLELGNVDEVYPLYWQEGGQIGCVVRPFTRDQSQSQHKRWRILSSPRQPSPSASKPMKEVHFKPFKFSLGQSATSVWLTSEFVGLFKGLLLMKKERADFSQKIIPSTYTMVTKKGKSIATIEGMNGIVMQAEVIHRVENSSAVVLFGDGENGKKKKKKKNKKKEKRNNQEEEEENEAVLFIHGSGAYHWVTLAKSNQTSTKKGRKVRLEK